MRSIKLSIWTKEIQRDILALGSPVFYFLVIARALVGPFWDLANPLVFLAPVVLLASYLKLSADLYIARAVLMTAVITKHYNDVLFGVFAGIVVILMMISSLRLGSATSRVRNGFALGTILAIIGIFIAQASK
jgi:hypothetical protein